MNEKPLEEAVRLNSSSSCLVLPEQRAGPMYIEKVRFIVLLWMVINA